MSEPLGQQPKAKGIWQRLWHAFQGFSRTLPVFWLRRAWTKKPSLSALSRTSDLPTEPATVFWDGDALFRAVTTFLTPIESTPLALLSLTVSRLIVSRTTPTIVDRLRERLTEVYPQRADFLQQRLDELLQHFELVPEPMPEEVKGALPEVADAGDAPVLAAAKASGCLVLLTYNTQDFAQAKGIVMMTPKELVQRLRAVIRADLTSLKG